jgi:hypothetical protein
MLIWLRLITPLPNILVNMKSISIYSTQKRPHLHPDTQFLYLHKFFYGGVTTFTAHLFYTMGLTRKSQNTHPVLRPSIKSENILRDFGYGLHYQNMSVKSLRHINFPFITVVKDNYYYALKELSENQKRRTSGIKTIPIIVIHDPRDVSERIALILKTWKVVTIRRTAQRYLEKKYGLESSFLFHPFFPYYTSTTSNLEFVDSAVRSGAISISRIGFGKNIDLIVKANKILDSQNHGELNTNSGISNSIKIYGCPTPKYVYLFLNNNKRNNGKRICDKNSTTNGDFRRYYYGKFEKSFSAVSELLSKHKFVVDLSIVKNDGGGTQYTFLEAIHNGCALILNRKWVEGTYTDPGYRDFKEGYNCFAVENENELAEIIKSDPDTRKVNENARKLMYRHYNMDWSQMIENYE